jgi:hypothetical protein
VYKTLWKVNNMLLLVVTYKVKRNECKAAASHREVAVELIIVVADCDNGLYTYQSDHNTSLSFSLVGANGQ